MKPNFVSVTRGPGISVALSIGLEYAKGLATAWQVPLIGVNHMHAHTLAPRLAYALAQSDAWPQPAFPFLTLLVSGGHTMLHLSKSIYRHQRLAGTKDVAVGNALDQIARSILPPEVLDREIMYGRLLEEFAQCPPYTAPVNRGDLVQPYHSKSGWTLSMPLAETREMAFSYSGLESSVRRITKADLTVDERRELARQSLRIAFEHLADRVLLGLGNLGTEVRRLNALVVSGGVASNQYLRQILRAVLDAHGHSHIQIIFPPVELCTDNAAMVAWAGIELASDGWVTDQRCGPLSKWGLDPTAADGGLLGHDGCKRRPRGANL